MSGRWQEASAPLRREFAEVLDMERIRELHKKSALKHALVAIRQFLTAAVAALVIIRFGDIWWAWLPAAVLLGFMVFSFTVLLHEVVHHTVFGKRRTTWNRLLGWIYATPSGLAPSQFIRWHLDHHAELGDDELDPKRHRLTPKIVRRWYKALYLTPALFPIYFRAAAQEASGYDPKFRAVLRRERAFVISFHFAVMGAIFWAWGGPMLLQLYAVPIFLVFPIAFTINRLGQHYDIEPNDPAAWGTLVKTNPIWSYLFIWSNYHMEHHYFPGVPCYNLAALHRELKPIFERHPMRRRSYGGLLWDWFVKNRAPHVNWH
jgi:fatty acid desaturase